MSTQAASIYERLVKYSQNIHSYGALHTIFQRDSSLCKLFIEHLILEELHLDSRVHASFLSQLKAEAVRIKMTPITRTAQGVLSYSVIQQEETEPQTYWVLGWKLIHCILVVALSESWVESLQGLDNIPELLVQACARCGIQGSLLLDMWTCKISDCFKMVQQVVVEQRENRRACRTQAMAVRMSRAERELLEAGKQERHKRRFFLSSLFWLYTHLRKVYQEQDAEYPERPRTFSSEAFHYAALSLCSDQGLSEALDLAHLDELFTQNSEFFEDMKQVVHKARAALYARSEAEVKMCLQSADKNRLIPSPLGLQKRYRKGDIIFTTDAKLPHWVFEKCSVLPPSVALQNLEEDGAAALDYSRAAAYMRKLREEGESADHTVVLVFQGMGHAYRVRQALDAVDVLYPDLMTHIFDPPLWVEGADKGDVYLFITCQLLYCVRSLQLGHVAERWERFPDRVIMYPLLVRGMCCRPYMNVPNYNRSKDNLLFNISRYATLRTLLSWTTNIKDLDKALLPPDDKFFFVYKMVLSIVHRWTGRDLIHAEVEALVKYCKYRRSVDDWKASHQESERLPQELIRTVLERPDHHYLSQSAVEGLPSLIPDPKGCDSDEELDDLIDGGYGSDDSRQELPHELGPWALEGVQVKRQGMRRYRCDPARERNLFGILADFLTGFGKRHAMVTHKLRHIYMFANSNLVWAEKFKQLYKECYIFVMTADYTILKGGYLHSHVELAVDMNNESQRENIFPDLEQEEERNTMLTLQFYVMLCDGSLFSHAVARNLLRGIILKDVRERVELCIPLKGYRKTRIPLQVTERLLHYDQHCVMECLNPDGEGLPAMDIEADSYVHEEYVNRYMQRMGYNCRQDKLLKIERMERFSTLLQCLEWRLFYYKESVAEDLKQRWLLEKQSIENGTEGDYRSKGSATFLEYTSLGIPFGCCNFDPVHLLNSEGGVLLMLTLLQDGRVVYGETGLLLPARSKKVKGKLLTALARYDTRGVCMLSKEKAEEVDIFRRVERKTAAEKRRRSQAQKRAAAPETTSLLSEFGLDPYGCNLESLADLRDIHENKRLKTVSA